LTVEIFFLVLNIIYDCISVNYCVLFRFSNQIRKLRQLTKNLSINERWTNLQEKLIRNFYANSWLLNVFLFITLIHSSYLMHKSLFLCYLLMWQWINAFFLFFEFTTPFCHNFFSSIMNLNDLLLGIKLQEFLHIKLFDVNAESCAFCFT